MTDPTLVKGSGTFSSSGTATLTLYNSQTESFRKNSGMINLPIPASDSGSTTVYDLLGVTREITIRGRVTESDTTLTSFTADLNSLITGTQGNTGSSQVGYTLDPVSIGGTIRVYVQDVSWDYIAGEATTVEYSLSLIEVSSTSG